MIRPNIKDKIKIDEEEKSIIIPINPKIFALEVVYSAAYMFLDKAYILIDGDPEEEIFVQMIPKNENCNLKELKKMALEFENELINYSVYAIQAARTSTIRNAIVQRALGVVKEFEEVSEIPEKEFKEERMIHEETEASESLDEALEDPLGIAKPWSPEKMEGLEIPEEVKEIFKSIKEIDGEKHESEESG